VRPSSTLSARALVSIAGGASIRLSEAIPACSIVRICGTSLWSNEPTALLYALTAESS
jgi:hypothetical protein